MILTVSTPASDHSLQAIIHVGNTQLYDAECVHILPSGEVPEHTCDRDIPSVIFTYQLYRTIITPLIGGSWMHNNYYGYYILPTSEIVKLSVMRSEELLLSGDCRMICDEMMLLMTVLLEVWLLQSEWYIRI